MQPSFGLIRVVTSQQAIRGRPAELEEVELYFSRNGYVRRQLKGRKIWFRAADRIVCSDTHGGNILVNDGEMAAIDVPVMIAPMGFDHEQG